ncbi:SDR family NAD(P)-dependent oxidoreductase [Prolixibacter sp. NT017]|uniref:SDR family NAD(P)-dependent oxidoreductase n=1 Tax=Prolixibacter sp. NT017 TaxID=2652390 RepID=UPI0012868674|nr:SDR family NAD(P)-dependent oxidoreductase [Prolixibacter sp. NT017]GET23968.1 short-chain dehydrogenase/reductase [Prolixibacter sp. NT017]
MVQNETAKQTVLITGASSGIGKITAQVFANQGFRVLGTSRRKVPDAEGVEMLELNVCSDESVRQCVAEVLAKVERIDILVNNAGVEHLGIVEETTMKEVYSVFETNFFGVVRVTNAILPFMRKHRNGRIINIGSLAAWVGEPGEAFYSASKHALSGYTEALRHEVWPFGIDVSLVEPAAFKTNVINAASISKETNPEYNAVRSAARQTLQDSMGKGGDPMKVARLILKIARTRSPRFRYGVGAGARWIPYLRILLPQRTFDKLLRRGFGLRKIEDMNR